MADTKISAAADIVSVVGTDMLPVARSGSTTAYHATMAEIGTFAGANLPTASTTVLGGVKIDGSTISIASGVISAAGPSSGTPAMDGTAAPGAATTWSRGDHIHPTDVTRAPLASPTFTGTPSLPTGTTGVTQTAGNSTTALATTAFVATSFAPLASPTFTGTPSLPTGTTAVTQAVGTSSTTLATTAFVQAAAAPAFNDVGRNIVHNPVYTVAQRGTSFTALGYTLDRWMLLFNLDTGVTVTQVALGDPIRAAIGDESAQSCISVAFVGNAGAASYTELLQRIEGVRRLSGKTVTLSCWAWASAALQLGILAANVYGTGGSPSPQDNVTGIPPLSLTTSPQRFSRTFTMPSSSGKTFGTTAGTDFAQLQLWCSSGTTQAPSSGIGVQSGTIYLWGIQLEYGSVATPLAKRDPADELALCQRFYQIGGLTRTGYAGAASVVVGGSQPLVVSMRATPTLTPSWTAQTNGTGALAQIDASNIYPYITSTAAGQVSLQGTFTASADL